GHTRFKCDWSSDVCSSDLPVSLCLGHSRERGGKCFCVCVCVCVVVCVCVRSPCSSHPALCVWVCVCVFQWGAWGEMFLCVCVCVCGCVCVCSQPVLFTS